MKPALRYPVLLGVKVPADLAADVRRAASNDDRTVSAYVRRILVAAVRPVATDREEEAR